MKPRGRQVRFVAATMLGWVAVRVVLAAWSSGGAGAAEPVAQRRYPVAPKPLAVPPAPSSAAAVAPRVTPASTRPAAASRAPGIPSRPDTSPTRETAAAAVPAGTPPSSRGERAAVPGPPLPGKAQASRWSASASLFARPGRHRPSLSPAGQLGGSQMAARIAYRLNDAGPVRTAAVARLYAPLSGAGAEAAIGLDWHPAPAAPLRLAVERRIALDHAGRNAWSAYGAGGFYTERRGIVIDGYAQAGVVGARARDPFADGAVRAGYKTTRGASLIVGAGLWGAAQPGLSRIDAGPRAALVLPVAGHTVSAAVEGRFRLTGQARPGSGAALTVGVDF